MQKLPIYLYPNTLELILDMDTVKGSHDIMYQRDLVIQKGVRTQVQLQFKNSDQKYLNVSSSTFVMILVDPQDKKNKITKAVEILDNGTTHSLRGLGKVVFSESDTIDLESKHYNFAVLKSTNGSLEPAYSNTYYGVSGQLELRSDIYPQASPSTRITTFQRVWNNDPDKLYWEYSTGNIYADPEFQGGRALHTMAIYMTGYRGRIYIEGTLDNSPGTFADYDTIITKTYTAKTGIVYFNFNGIFSSLRLRYIPDTGPGAIDNSDTSYAGTIDKVLHRS